MEEDQTTQTPSTVVRGTGTGGSSLTLSSLLDSFSSSVVNLNVTTAEPLSPQPDQPLSEENRDISPTVPSVNNSFNSEQETWMPKPARFHQGKRTSCEICNAPLLYCSSRAIKSWDAYLQSQEFLQDIHSNITKDSFITSLLCGKNYFGDLPIEHRIHAGKRKKFQQNVKDFTSMTEAGILDHVGKEKTTVRLLEELLITSLPTSTFTHMLERRLAVILRSTKPLLDQSFLDENSGRKKYPVTSGPAPDMQLHHLAISTLLILLETFDYANPDSKNCFQMICSVLSNFPVLSLHKYWSPLREFPEKAIFIPENMVYASSTGTNRVPSMAIDGLKTTFWCSSASPGPVYFTILLPHASSKLVISSLHIHWHLKYQPINVSIQYKRKKDNNFATLTMREGIKSSNMFGNVERFLIGKALSCVEIRIEMSGIDSGNHDGLFGIDDLKINTSSSTDIYTDPVESLMKVQHWLFGGISHSDSGVVCDAISALKSWALVTGSLPSSLYFIETISQIIESADLSTIVKDHMLNEGIAFFEELSIVYETSNNSKRKAKVSGTASGCTNSDGEEIACGFDASLCSSGVAIEEDGQTVTTTETNYQHALVNFGITSGQAAWEFRLDADVVDDEMTCFGACILPISISSYDSSPSMWMLRGYNGNLYARGHKLNRIIGKVHPGDVVRCEVDMSLGTLAYFINGISYGVVFNDLKGYEIFPAISFYGTGKATTLLKVEAWGESMKTRQRPIYLYNLPEYDYQVGLGEMGRGTRLGYECGDDSNSDGAIIVQNEKKLYSLSTHPPKEGSAYVVFDLGCNFKSFRSAVALNDSSIILIENNSRSSNYAQVVFRVYGDGKLLWTSKVFGQNILSECAVEKVQLDVSNVMMLELQVTCVGNSNIGAHAIWVDPHLICFDEWKCVNCSFVNNGVCMQCDLCQKPHVILPTAQDEKEAEKEEGVGKIDKDHKVRMTQELSSQANCENINNNWNSYLQIELKIWENLCKMGELFLERKDDQKTNSDQQSKQQSFEEPFCIEPTGRSMEYLLKLLETYVAKLDENVSERELVTLKGICCKVMELFEINFKHLTSFILVELLKTITLSPNVIERLKSLLECLAGVHLANLLSPNSQSRALQKAKVLCYDLDDKQHINEFNSHPIQVMAARCLISGLVILYPLASDRIGLLMTLLQCYKLDPFATESARYLLLTQLLSIFVAPGEDGIICLVPFISRNKCSKYTSDSDLDHALKVRQIMNLLMEILRENINNAYDDVISTQAMNLIISYQRLLLCKVIDLSKGSLKKQESNVMKQSRVCAQDAVVRYACLLINHCREILERAIVSSKEEQPFCENVSFSRNLQNELKDSILGRVLPWFTCSLCLLRRQPWLAESLLPSITRLLGQLDLLCAEFSDLCKSERRLKIRESKMFYHIHHHSSSSIKEEETSIQNLFQRLYTGPKDHFEGQIGFQFEATCSFAIVALGRSVNPSVNRGKLLRTHTIRLWDDATQILLTEITVDSNSRLDSLGYSYEILGNGAIEIQQGNLYRITSHEYSNSGDPWYKKENLPDEEYDTQYIKILRDCYAAGSTSFPNSQNMVGAAYGVPTLFIAAKDRVKHVPSFFAADGSYVNCSNSCNQQQNLVVFNEQSKSTGLNVGFGEAEVNVISSASSINKNHSFNSNWKSILTRSGVVAGVQTFEFVLTRTKRTATGTLGHVCVGVAHKYFIQNQKTSTFIGGNLFDKDFSFGWIPTNGSVWYKGQRYVYGCQNIVLSEGDILTLSIDLDRQEISFEYNNICMGVALSCRDGMSSSALILDDISLPSTMYPGLSLYGSNVSVKIQSGGMGGSSFSMHWLLDLLNTVSSLAGRLAGGMIAGYPIDCLEEELQPWLQSNLFRGGMNSELVHYDLTQGRMKWTRAWQNEQIKFPSLSAFASINCLSNTLMKKKEQPAVIPISSSACSSTSHKELYDEAFILRLTAGADCLSPLPNSSVVGILLKWLKEVCPDKSFLSRLGEFPRCEQLMMAALIKHSPPHILEEAKAIVTSVEAHSDFALPLHIRPSENFLMIWKYILKLRHAIIRAKHEYASKINITGNQSFDEEEGKDDDIRTKTTEPDQNKDSSILGTINEEFPLSPPKTFDSFCEEICKRGRFLCNLTRPIPEENQRLDKSVQLALSKLAEKWSIETPSPRLEPMVERWKSLSESDSIKWSSVVNVLRAQHNWRTRHCTTDSAATCNNLVPAAKEDLEVVENDEESQPQQPVSNFIAILRACFLYIRNGVGAPPDMLVSLLERRVKRSESRIYGLEAMQTILELSSFNTAKENALLYLRPAFRGFTEGEKESRESTNDDIDLNSSAEKNSKYTASQISTTLFRGTVRHHYLKGLEGCNRLILEQVQQSFCGLYTKLAETLASLEQYRSSENRYKSGCHSLFNCQMARAIMCAWSLDFEPRDHEFLLQSGILTTLQNYLSAESRIYELRLLTQLGEKVEKHKVGVDLNWSPTLSPISAHEKLFKLPEFGTKRRILLSVQSAPAWIRTPSWLKKHNLLLNDQVENDRFNHLCCVTSASSVSLIYEDLIREIKRKQHFVVARQLHPVLYFGLRNAVSFVQTQCKVRRDSKVELPPIVPQISCVKVKAFTLELWMFATKLHGGYSTLFSECGFQKSRPHLEIVNQSLQLAVQGNAPREQRFCSVIFQTHQWYHIAVVYNCESTSLYVNGLMKETKKYISSVESIIFSQSQLGSWAQNENDAGVDKHQKRCFSGALANVRLWNCAQSAFSIRRNCYRRLAIETPHLINMWYLNEGNGNYAGDISCADITTPVTGYERGIIHNCQWYEETLPFIDKVLSDEDWAVFEKGIFKFQTIVQEKLRRKYNRLVEQVAIFLNQQENCNWQDDRFLFSDDEEGDEALELKKNVDDVSKSKSSMFVYNTEDVSFGDIGVSHCAWLLFQLISTVGICGIKERRSSEVNDDARLAKKKRKKSESENKVLACVTHANNSSSKDAVSGSGKVGEEEDESANMKAQSAATDMALEEPAVQTLWYSTELQRKVFGLIEEELNRYVDVLQNSDSLQRGQRPICLRSMSTPSHRQHSTIKKLPVNIALPEPSFVPLTKLPSSRNDDTSSSNKKVLLGEDFGEVGWLEPLELERRIYQLLLFLYAQSNTHPGQLHLVQHKSVQQLLLLLRLGSPRCQRLINLVLTSISHLVNPELMGRVLTSESSLIELLLDRVAEAMCIPINLNTTSNTTTTVAESLANPLGFLTGDFHLNLSSESLALLRVFLNEPRWGPTVWKVLKLAIINASQQQDQKKDEIRFSATIVRALAALCVLGAYTGCLRVGGKVKALSNTNTSSISKKPSDLDRINNRLNSSTSRGTDSSSSFHVATIIKLNSSSPTARLLFDGSSDKSDPVHNVQEVELASIQPIEEGHCTWKVMELITPEMMSVLLQFALMPSTHCNSRNVEHEQQNEEAKISDVLLWRCQIQTRALLVLESILRTNQSSSSIESGDVLHHQILDPLLNSQMWHSLMNIALQPVSLSRFYTLSFLQERSRKVLCRLIESATRLGPNMFASLGSPPKPAMILREKENGTMKRVVKEETEEDRTRRELASNLAVMGFDINMCITALERSNDDANVAVEWLMGPEALNYNRTPPTIFHDSSPGTNATVLTSEENRQEKAVELEMICGLPGRLIVHALELCRDDPNETMGWLMEHGTKYLSTLDNNEFVPEQVNLFDDKAVFDHLESAELFPTTLCTTDSTVGVEDERQGQMEVSLDHIVYVDDQLQASGREDNQMLSLDPNYLKENVVLTVSEEVGPSMISRRTGTYVKCDETRRHVLLKFVDLETGGVHNEWHSISKVRRFTEMYGQPLINVNSVHDIAYSTEMALTTHYARHVIACLLEKFAQRTDKNVPSQLLNMLGGAPQFVSLVKLVAASEKRLDTVADSNNKTSEIFGWCTKQQEEQSLTMDSLSKLMLMILSQEKLDNQAGNTANEQIEETTKTLSRVLVQECIFHFTESTQVNSSILPQQEDSNSSNQKKEQKTKAQFFQSLHPYFPRSEYVFSITTSSTVADDTNKILKPSYSIGIIFDKRCKFGSKTTLTFYEDAGLEHEIAALTHNSKFKMITIHNQSRVWVRFLAKEDNVETDYGYGYHFQVERLVSNVKWDCEAQIVTGQPSLEWACWVLEFLLNDAQKLIHAGAVHNQNVCQALLRYLRSPGVQFKSRVIRLLTQLFIESELFTDTQFSLEPFEKIGHLALDYAKIEKESEIFFLSPTLLQLVELAMAISTAKDSFHISKVDEIEAIEPPVAIEELSMHDILKNTIQLMDFLLATEQLKSPTKLNTHLLTRMWIDVYGGLATVESPHPYDIEVHEMQGTISFPGARALLLNFDARCCTCENVSLIITTTTSTSESAGENDVVLEKIYSGRDWPYQSSVEITGSQLTYQFKGSGSNPDSLFGILFTVSALDLSVEQLLYPLRASGSLKKLENDLMKPNACASNANEEVVWNSTRDSQLVEWVNNKLENEGRLFSSLSVSELKFNTEKVADHNSATNLLLANMPLRTVQIRFSLLALFNRLLKLCLELIDLSDTDSSYRIGYRLRRLAHCVFFDLKNRFVDVVISKTWVAPESSTIAKITLDRLQALESREDQEVEPSISGCFFAQAFRQLHQKNPNLLRRKIDSKGRLFSVKFRSEEGVDWGGVYREGANSIVDDLFSSHFNLFILCPNGQHDTGLNRGMYLPNPYAISPVAIQMFEFVGKLLAISFRTKADFPFCLPSIVWKKLICQPEDVGDLEGTDSMLVQMLDGIRYCERDGITNNEEFSCAFDSLDLRFVASGSTGQEVELIEEGKQKPVNFQNRIEYCNLVVQYRLNEGNLQIAAMRRGFATIFPINALKILKWEEMEMLTCGSPKISVKLWQQHTRYDGYNENDDVVKLFWKVMASFTDKERSDFVRFAWGRSRLPRGRWPQPFKLTRKGGRDSTSSLPVAHTCFFSVELPPYTTETQMKNMLLATINFGLGGILMA